MASSRSKFILKSCKYVYRHQDVNTYEGKLWMDHLHATYSDTRIKSIDQAFRLSNPPYKYDYDTDDLRICYWEWIDAEGKSHELLDMNDFPGDNQSGFIAIDGRPIYHNIDGDFLWIINGIIQNDSIDDPLPLNYLDILSKIHKLSKDSITVFPEKPLSESTDILFATQIIYPESEITKLGLFEEIRKIAYYDDIYEFDPDSDLSTNDRQILEQYIKSDKTKANEITSKAWNNYITYFMADDAKHYEKYERIMKEHTRIKKEEKAKKMHMLSTLPKPKFVTYKLKQRSLNNMQDKDILQIETPKGIYQISSIGINTPITDVTDSGLVNVAEVELQVGTNYIDMIPRKTYKVHIITVAFSKPTELNSQIVLYTWTPDEKIGTSPDYRSVFSGGNYYHLYHPLKTSTGVYMNNKTPNIWIISNTTVNSPNLTMANLKDKYRFPK